ncbi:MAG: hypothetical protein PHX82_12645, partial [Paracoccaceae bacterium]|nr:hypothetical protein [Paracoccaceae bacterium]
MKPSFALNLSHDGIGLLHRTGNSWFELGSVALDAPDLTEALAALHRTAQDIAPQGVSCKLIIPATQILYTDIAAPGPRAAQRRRQIAAALEGMTPYDVADLVFDWSGHGDVVQVAVVARETLAEAEGFAETYGFGPVSFVAMPAPGQFAGEPYFGMTSVAGNHLPEGARLDRDQDPVRIVAAATAGAVAAPDAMAEPAAPTEAPVETPTPVEVPQDAPAELPQDAPAPAPEPAPQELPPAAPELPEPAPDQPEPSLPEPNPEAPEPAPPELDPEPPQDLPEPDAPAEWPGDVPLEDPMVVDGPADLSLTEVATALPDTAFAAQDDDLALETLGGELSDPEALLDLDLALNAPLSPAFDAPTAHDAAAVPLEQDTPDQTATARDERDWAWLDPEVQAPAAPIQDTAVTPAAQAPAPPVTPEAVIAAFQSRRNRDLVAAPDTATTPATAPRLGGVGRITPVAPPEPKSRLAASGVTGITAPGLALPDAAVETGVEEKAKKLGRAARAGLGRAARGTAALSGSASKAIARGLAARKARNGDRKDLAAQLGLRTAATASAADAAQAPLRPTPATEDPASDADTTVFGARRVPKISGKPKHLGVKLTGGLILFIAIVALWSSFLGDQSPPEAEPQTARLTETAPAAMAPVGTGQSATTLPATAPATEPSEPTPAPEAASLAALSTTIAPPQDAGTEPTVAPDLPAAADPQAADVAEETTPAPSVADPQVSAAPQTG